MTEPTNQPPQSPYPYIPPQQPKKSHKVRNWTLGIVGGFLTLSIIGSFLPDEETDSASSEPTTTQTEQTTNAGSGKADKPAKKDKPAKDKPKRKKKAEPKPEPVEETTEAPEPEPTEEPEPVDEGPSVEQENALGSASDYLDFGGFSASGLVDQLEFEGYSTADAQWAVDNCGADWNEEAAQSAQEYMDFSSFSRQGLIDQLTFEGYTAEQAAYGADSVGL